MHPQSARMFMLPVSLAALAAAAPAPIYVPEPDAAAPHDPLITPSLVEYNPSRTVHVPRNLIDDVEGRFDSVLSNLGSDVPSYVASGVPDFFQGFPTGDKVQSSLGIDDDQVAALPTQVLNLPPYANWTDEGWNVRFHGNVYKQPNTSTEKLNELANVFLVGEDIEDLPEDQQDNARNMTASIFVLQQDNVNVSTIHLEPAPSQGASGQPGGGGAETAKGGRQDVQMPYNTTFLGDYDEFVPIKLNGLTPGNETSKIQRLNAQVEGASEGNATVYLIPPKGISVVSDIDDTLRVTKIYDPKEGLLNSFARDFTPWEDMPGIYANWSRNLPDVHFAYLSTTPEQVSRAYMDFIYGNFPGGSFDTRPLNFSDVKATLSIRAHLLTQLFETFPQRKFVLVGDSSNPDIMKDYPQMAIDFPEQVQCILLRNVTATDDSDHFPYDTSKFEDLKQNQYMFFKHSDDLMGLDIEGGGCYNQSIAQNVTFGYQGLPFGDGGEDSAVNGSANGENGGGDDDDESAAASLRFGGVQYGAAFAGLLGMLMWQLL
ncbi:hypothetical protein Q7P37_006122 [Cladosporium fusiforme]